VNAVKVEGLCEEREQFNKSVSMPRHRSLWYRRVTVLVYRALFNTATTLAGMQSIGLRCIDLQCIDIHYSDEHMTC
jgi:hypothetical protein